MAYEFSVSDSVVSAIITILIASAVIYFAARMVLDRSSFLAAIGSAVVATFLATLVVAFLAGTALSGTWALVIGIAVWALVTAIFFRTDWIKGAIIGVVAWLLWFLISLAVGALFG